MKIDIEERIKNIICEKLGVHKEDVTDDAEFIADLGADSLDIIELIMEFEKTFDVKISDEISDKIETVGDAVNAVVEQKEND